MDVVGLGGTWVYKTYSWTSGAVGAAVIQIKNRGGNYNMNTFGMDLLLDDISFVECIDDGGRSGSITGIEKSEMSHTANLTVMPNPSDGNTVVKSTVDMNASLINELGQVVRFINLNAANNHSVQLENLDAGIYFLNSYSKDGVSSQKIVVTK
jgi:hypothetical protein